MTLVFLTTKVFLSWMVARTVATIMRLSKVIVSNPSSEGASVFRNEILLPLLSIFLQVHLAVCNDLNFLSSDDACKQYE